MQCGARIEKNGGCDRMACINCRKEFCWVCVADYGRARREGNKAHEKSCKYHSGKLQSFTRGGV